MNSNKKIAIISFNYMGKIYPVIKVIDNNSDQVVVIFRDRPIHLTSHRDREGKNILMTVYDKNKPLSGGGKARIAIARKLGYRDPERHAKYIAHHLLFKCINDNGYYLMGRITNLADCPSLNRKEDTVIVCSDKSDFLLELYLSTLENTRSNLDAKYASTSLGDVYFEIKEIGNYKIFGTSSEQYVGMLSDMQVIKNNALTGDAFKAELKKPQDFNR